MNAEDKLMAVQQAQELIEEAIVLLEPLAKLDRMLDREILARLKIICSNGHGYLDSSPTLDDIIIDLKAEAEFGAMMDEALEDMAQGN